MGIGMNLKDNKFNLILINHTPKRIWIFFKITKFQVTTNSYSVKHFNKQLPRKKYQIKNTHTNDIVELKYKAQVIDLSFKQANPA